MNLSPKEPVAMSWHTLSPAAACARLQSTPAGLTGVEAARRLTEYGPNELHAAQRISPWTLLFAQFKNVLIVILLAATALSAFHGEIGLMSAAMLLGLPLPLTAVQILYVNLATDGLPALALALDPPEPDLMRRKPNNPRKGIFTRPVVTLMVIGGMWSMLVNLSLFAWALNSGRSAAEAMTMTFVSLVLIQFVKAYNFRSDRLSVFNRPFANTWLNWAIAWELVLLLVIVYVPAFHAPFGAFSLPLVDWAIVIGLALTISPVLEAAKWMERRGWFGEME